MFLMDAFAHTAVLATRPDHRLGMPDLGINHLPSPLLSIYPDLTKRMQHAPRFLLDNGAIDAAVELTLGRPKVMLEALTHCRVPYNSVWIEWEEAGRARIRETFHELAIEQPGRPLPKRVGCLFECEKGGRQGTITWGWSTDDPGLDVKGVSIPNTSPIIAYFNLDDEQRQSDRRTQGLLQGNICRLWKDNPVQLDALMGLWRTAIHAPSSWGFQYLEYLDRAVGRSQQRIEEAMADVYGEYIIAWAVMLLLTSSRQTVDYKPVDRSKINKIRKKKGEAQLFDHTEVTMHIGQHAKEGQRRQPLGYQRKSPRIHLVSRFLNRRGNKHWIVEPFLRGQGEWAERHIHVKR